MGFLKTTKQQKQQEGISSYFYNSYQLTLTLYTLFICNFVYSVDYLKTVGGMAVCWMGMIDKRLSANIILQGSFSLTW